MKVPLVCSWFFFALIEAGLTLWFHSANFLAIAVVAALMIAFNLQSSQTLHPASARVAFEPAQV